MEVRSLVTRELWWRDFFSVLKHVSSPKAQFLVLSALEVVSLSLEIRSLLCCFCLIHRVFSEGGNFSTDEVEEYRKKLVSVCFL